MLKPLNHKVAVQISSETLHTCGSVCRGPTVVWASQVALEIKNPPANVGEVRDSRSIPGSGRSPGAEHGSPLQYFCLEDPMDRGAWWAIVLGPQRAVHD